MPYKTTKTYVRPSTDVEFHTTAFFKDTSEEALAIGDQWKNLNIQYELFSRRTFTEIDENTLEVIIIWDSKEQCIAYRTDPAFVAHSARIDQYNTDHNIIVTSTEEEV
jgi:hypothetical protein